MASRHYRGAALARLFQIVTLMHGGGRLTQRDFAEACGCSDRQVRRYLLALEEAGVPFDQDRKRGYFLEPGWTPYQLSLTLTEALALLLARQAVVGRSEMPFAHSAQTAFDKVAALLPPTLRARLEEDSVTYYSAGKRNYSQAPWNEILSAVHKREVVEMEYYTISRDATSVRKIDPYHIVWLGNYCSLIGYCHTRHEILHFALDGIRWMRSTGEQFIVPKEFSLAAHLRGAHGPVLGKPTSIRVRFDAQLARYAKRKGWDFPHDLFPQPDGTLVLEGTVLGLDDIRKELLTWGRHVVVLEPVELREAIFAEARAIVDLYASS